MAQIKDKVVGGLLWKFLERISTQGVTFVLQIILARLLLPEEYGLIAMINVFIALANIFVTSGFSTSLIQKKDADDLDFSTILWSSLAVSVFLYVILYFAAPFIASFYEMPQLVPVTRIYSISLIFLAYNSIQQAYVSRKMLFRKMFYSTLFGSILSGIIGIVFAYLNFGIWSLVSQYTLNIIFNIIILQCIIDWKAKLVFSWNRAKKLMKYGSNILGAAFVGQLFEELRQLLIGKYYTAADLAYFNRGRALPTLISSNIEASINQVMFPAMSDYSDKPLEIKNMVRRSIQVSSFVMYFFMTLLAVASRPIIILLLTEKWAPAVPYMQMICISSMIAIMSTANMQAIKAIGRSDIVLKLEFWKKPAFLIILFCAVQHSVYAVALTMPIYSLYAAIVNMWPNKKLLNYSIVEQFRDQMPAVLLAGVSAVVSFPLFYLDVNQYIIMILQIATCSILYFGLSYIFRVETYEYLIRSVRNYIMNRK